MCGKYIEAKEVVINRRQPVIHGRLLKVANAVNVWRHPVAGNRHVRGGFRMRCIGVVQKTRREKRSKIYRQKQKDQYGPDASAGGQQSRLLLGRLGADTSDNNRARLAHNIEDSSVWCCALPAVTANQYLRFSAHPQPASLEPGPGYA